MSAVEAWAAALIALGMASLAKLAKDKPAENAFLVLWAASMALAMIAYARL